MTRTGERDLSRIGSIDYMLMTAGSCLAAFSGGMAIQQPSVAAFTMVAIVGGALTSYLIRTLFLSNPLIKLDGYLYSAGVLAAFVFGAQLQVLMPEGGYPLDVLAAGWLAWMLIFGSFFTWQDSTLLFQAIPSIALLGLVGVYDTFSDVRFAFFAFLLCMATLFARAHRRAMLKQAADSGYFTRGLAPGTPTPSVDTTPGLARRMEEGPWRWIAGPQWALGSAFAVVLISLLGTPVVQKSVEGVSGFVKVPVPRSIQARNKPATTMPQDVSGGIRVGQGPNRLTYDPVLEVSMDHARYLRSAWYDTYVGGSWRSTLWNPSPPLEALETVDTLDFRAIADPQDIKFAIRPKKPMRSIPVPGSLQRWDRNRQPGVSTPDGRLESYRSIIGEVFSGEALVAPEGRPVEAIKKLPAVYGHMLDADSVTPRMRAMVANAVGDAKDDFTKAERIRDAIAKRIVYNLEAEAAPPDSDPVDYVLFDQKEAYCDIYASAMVLLARSAGIPARYAVGYLPDETERDENGIYVVLESDLHAWAELFFKDYGWVVFDATGGARAVPGGERGSANDLGPFWARPWFKTGLDVVLGALALAAAYLVLKPIVLRQRSMTPRLELGDAYMGFARVLEQATRTRRDVSTTPDEFLGQTRERLGPLYPDAKEINDRFVAFLYAPGSVTSSEVAQLRSQVRNFRQRARKATERSSS